MKIRSHILLAIFLSWQMLAFARMAGPVDGAKIIVEQPHGDRFETKTSRDGNFELEKIPPGSYIIRLVPPAGAEIMSNSSFTLTIIGLHEGRFEKKYSAEEYAGGITVKGQIIGGKISGRILIEM